MRHSTHTSAASYAECRCRSCPTDACSCGCQSPAVLHACSCGADCGCGDDCRCNTHSLSTRPAMLRRGWCF